jgi:hypothetical protein
LGTGLLRDAEGDLVTVSRLMGRESAVTTTLNTQPTEAALAIVVKGLG